MITAQLSISLDGYIAGPNAGPGSPLGDGGARLHQWVFGLKFWRARQGLGGGEDSSDSRMLDERAERTGSVVMGRGMFDEGEEPWGPEPPFRAPVFVVTHRERDVLAREGGTSFTFVTDGLPSAVEQARAAAAGKAVDIAGGAATVRQALEHGLLDELQLHVVPVLFGDGTRLFEGLKLRQAELQRPQVVESAEATHLTFRIGT